ncbi:hypothetical protein NIES4101_87210 [Calothrix sp. NIES-4101]|nr:hypothetical protein NIES4101_87210 [Calothrix sp. NIES-4101]
MKIKFGHTLINSVLYLSLSFSTTLTITFNQTAIAKKIPSKNSSKTIQVFKPNELAKLQKKMKEEMQATLDLAGLGKIVKPPTFDANLQPYRAQWSKVNPQIAPFLGYWMNNWEMFQPAVTMVVFPSTVKGQVCMIEYQDNENYIIYPGEPRPPNPMPRFYTLKINQGQGQQGKFRLHKSLISKNNIPGDMEFLGIAIGKQKVQLYASKGIPKLDSSLPTEVIQKFKANQCREK